MQTKNYVKFFIPSTNHGQRIDNSQFFARIEHVETALCKMLGGCTVHLNNVGSWYSEDEHRIIREDVAIVESFIFDESFNIADIHSAAVDYVNMFNQYSFLYVVNGTAYIVDSDEENGKNEQ